MQRQSQPDPVPDATALLLRAKAGDASAFAALLPLVYDQLRAMAGGYFRGQRANHTLQPTVLMHEAYLKLVRKEGHGWRGQAHVCAVAATAMRQIVANHAEGKRAAKRGAPGPRHQHGDIQHLPADAR